MELRTRRGYTQEPDEVSDDTPVQILDKQEQQETVSELVKLAQQSLELHRNLVSALQAGLTLLLLVKTPPSASSYFFTLPFLFLSLVRAQLSIPLPPSFPPVPFNLALLIFPALSLLYLYTSDGRETLNWVLWGAVPFGVIGLRLGTEWEGERAVKEAKGLEGLMYESPEA